MKFKRLQASNAKIQAPKFSLMNTDMTLRTLPWETLLRIAQYLRIDEIQKLSLALSRSGETLLVDDEYLFKQLARRDFELDWRLSPEIDTVWSWKQLYRALLGLRRQIIHEMEICRSLIFPCHAPPLLIPPVPLRLHRVEPDSDQEDDDDDFHHGQVSVKLATSWARCVFLDDRRQLAFVSDDADAMVATRDFINLESQQILQQRNIMEARFNPLHKVEKLAPHGRQSSFVKEGLCVWVEATKVKHCRYKLLYPMAKLRQVFEQCRIYVEQRVAKRKQDVDRVLNQTLVLKYRVDKPTLIGPHSQFLWEKLQRIFKRAELEIVTMKFDAGGILEFTVKRKIEWVHARLCLGDDCLHRIPRKLVDMPYDHEDIFEVLRRHLCSYHLVHNHYDVVDILNQRARYMETEHLNFFSRDFRDPAHHLNLKEEFFINITNQLVIDFKRSEVVISE